MKLYLHIDVIKNRKIFQALEWGSVSRTRRPIFTAGLFPGARSRDGHVLKQLNIQVDPRKIDCRCDYNGDNDVGKNQPGSEDALAAIGTSARRMAHPLPTLRAERLH